MRAHNVRGSLTLISYGILARVLMETNGGFFRRFDDGRFHREDDPQRPVLQVSFLHAAAVTLSPFWTVTYVALQLISRTGR